MSISKKGAERKRLAAQLELTKGSIAETLKTTLQKTMKRRDSQDFKKSKEKTMKIVGSRNRLGQVQGSSKYQVDRSKYQVDRSKESKESKESLSRSTHSYYIIQPKAKRSGSATDKHMRSQKSKEITHASNVINSTFEMQSLISTHKKKQSNYSSVVGSHFDMLYLNRSALSPPKPNDHADHADQADQADHPWGNLLLKSEAVLERYRVKNELLERENRQYKRKYR
jgi:hypothetical protein